MTKQSFYITTPIYYVNDSPHIGHAYTTLACDVLARFKRLDGYNVFFLTGTDEHGQKVEKSALAAGVEPQAFCDRVSQTFRDLCKAMNFSNDDFIRTTEERHKKAAQALWQKLVDAGHVYLGKYAGWYSVRDEAFFHEDELTLSPEGAKLAPTGAPVEWVEEESYFFKLSAFQDKLLDWYERNPFCVLPHSRLNEVKSFVRGGLRDLSISRTTFKWGVPVPGNDKHIMYVWIDALTNYLTAVGYPDADSAEFQKFWPTAMHMVGKDILKFHAVYWPAFLMGAGVEPPTRVFAHGWWTIDGQKMSKSIGNVIAPLGLVEKYGLDQTRYFLLAEAPFGGDCDFSHEAMVRRINGNLANGLGNLAQRTLSFIQKNAGGVVPERGEFTPDDRVLLDKVAALLPTVRAELDEQAFHKALEAIWAVEAAADEYIDKMAPWTLKKTGDIARMNTVLYALLGALRHLGVILLPFMPDSMGKLLDLLAVPESERDFAHLTPEFALKPGTPLPVPVGLFPRFVEEGA